MIRSTHTLAELELPKEAYDAVREALLNAGATDRIQVRPGAGLDLHGIMLVCSDYEAAS